jgi:DNA-binding CsgD family transcriptional regulator
MLVRLGPAEDRHLSGDVLRARFGLSAAECRVAAAVAGGYGPSETARRLSLSIHTVRSHLKRIYQKLGVHSQTALVRLLLQASKGRCGTGE